MKIRIQNGSIRFRLTRSEVERLIAGRCVVSRTGLPGGISFIFELRTAARGQPPTVLAAERELCVMLSRSSVDQWTDPTHVGFEFQTPTGPNDVLSILVEKDFACLDRAEAEPDAFPNPKACLVA